MAINNDKNGMNRCPKCGATDVSLNPQTGKLKCNYCRTLFDGVAANAAGGMENLKGDIVGDGAGDIIPDEKVILTLKCPACSAEVVINTEEATSARCHWCRHVLSVNEKLPNGAVPDLVLPFKTEKQTARDKINEFVKKRQFFAHPKFKAEFSTENIMGVYLPYMIVDVNSHAKMAGTAEHLVRSYTEGSGDNQRRYYDADAYTVVRDFTLLVDDLTIEASGDKLNQNILVNTNNVINAIMPFDTENAVAWNPNYLRGYASEKRDTDIKALRPYVDLQVGDIARYRVKESMTFYDRGTAWSTEDVNVIGTQWKSAYLPVWLYSYLEKSSKGNMLHYVAVNARTGETMGSVPLNKVRLMWVSAIIEIIGVAIGLTWLRFWIGIDTDEDNPALYGLLGFTPGFIFYWIMTNKYRNMSARHKHEADTKSQVVDMKKTDALFEHRKHLRSSRIAGENGNLIKGTVASNHKQMMGEKMANYLGIGRSEGSLPNQTQVGQDHVAEMRHKGKIVRNIIIVIFVIFFVTMVAGIIHGIATEDSGSSSSRGQSHVVDPDISDIDDCDAYLDKNDYSAYSDCIDEYFDNYYEKMEDYGDKYDGGSSNYGNSNYGNSSSSGSSGSRL